MWMVNAFARLRSFIRSLSFTTAWPFRSSQNDNNHLQFKNHVDWMPFMHTTIALRHRRRLCTDAFNARAHSHVSMCVCVSRLRLRLSAEHNHFIVIASDVFCLSTQHSMCHVSRLHYVLCIWKACWGLHEQQIAVVGVPYRLHQPANHFQRICIGLLSVIRKPLAYNANTLFPFFFLSAKRRRHRRKMFPSNCGMSAPAKGSAAL